MFRSIITATAGRLCISGTFLAGCGLFMLGMDGTDSHKLEIDIAGCTNISSKYNASPVVLVV